MFVQPVDPRILLALADLRAQRFRALAAFESLAMGNWIRYELAPAAYVAPERNKIIIAQRDAIGEQRAPGCITLITALDAGGWRWRATYAMAQLADGSMVESCVLWYVRGQWRGRASWHRPDGTSWAFKDAWIGPWQYGWQRSKTDPSKPTICEAVRAGGY